MIKLNELTVRATFVVLAIAATIIKIVNWSKRRRGERFQVKYFICYFSFMAGLIFQGPYVYQRYLDCGISTVQIGKIMTVFNVVSSFYGLFVGHICSVIGHKRLIIVSSIILSLHGYLRSYGTYESFLAASFLMGISTSANKVVFEDYLIGELQSPGCPDDAQTVIQENQTLIQFIFTVITTPISEAVFKHYGSTGIFVTSGTLFLIAAIIILAVFPSIPPKKTQTPSFIEIFSGLKHLAVLVDFSYSLFIALYNPRWLSFQKVENEQLPLSQMSASFAISAMFGASIFGALLRHTNHKYALFIIINCFLAALFAMRMTYDNKNLVFIFWLLGTCCDGGIGTQIRIMISESYPKDLRKYILGFLRVPKSLATSVILARIKGAESITFLDTSIAILAVTSLLSFARIKMD